MNNNENKVNLKETTSIDFLMLLNHFKANKWMLLIFMTLSLSFALYYTKHQTPVYETDILFQVDSKKNSNGILAGLSGGIETGAGTVITQIALLKSRFILNKVVEDLNLNINIYQVNTSFFSRLFGFNKKSDKQNIYIKDFIVPNSLVGIVFKVVVEKNKTVSIFNNKGQLILSGSSGEWLVRKDLGIKLYIDSINANPGQVFNLIKMPSSEISNQLLNQMKIVEINANGVSYSGSGILKMSLKGTNPKQITDILNDSLLVAKNRDIKNRSKEASKTIDFLVRQLPIIKKELLEAEQRLNNFQAQSGKLNLKFQTNYLLNQFMSFDRKLEKLRVEKASLLKKYTLNHPFIIRLNSDIDTVETQRSNLNAKLKTLPKSAQKNINLIRDVRVKETMYMLLLNKIQELEVVKAGTVGSIRILSKATVPTSPIPIKKVSVYFASCIVSLMMFFLVVFGGRFLFSKVEDPHWMERALGVPTLAILPYCREQSRTKPDNSKYKVLVAYQHPKSLTIEALRSLRTSLQVNFSVASNNVVSILGVSPHVGKSFLSNNFAYLLSSIGKKVVIVDCDLRAGTTHKYMHVDSERGLSEVLSGKLTLENVIKKTLHERLFCISRGLIPKDPSELLMSHKFKDVIDTLSANFDVVIIDTPPILLVTDALVVARFSSINYIVLGAGDHHPSEIENSIRKLMSAGIKLNGSIFNFHKEQRRLHGDSYGYSYNSKYYYNSYGHYNKESQDIS